MRKLLPSVIPYSTVIMVFAFGFGVIQHDAHRITEVALQSCENQQRVYHILASGMRRRAVYADAYPAHAYAHELRQEASEIEHIAAENLNCGKEAR